MWLFIFPTGQMSWKHCIFKQTCFYLGHRSKCASQGAINNTVSFLILKWQQNNFNHTENIQGKSCDTFEMWRGTKCEATISSIFIEKRKIKFSCVIGAGLASQQWGITIRQYVGQPQRGAGADAQTSLSSSKPACHCPSVRPPTPPAADVLWGSLSISAGREL